MIKNIYYINNFFLKKIWVNDVEMAIDKRLQKPDFLFGVGAGNFVGILVVSLIFRPNRISFR